MSLEVKKKVLQDIMKFCDDYEMKPFADKHKSKMVVEVDPEEADESPEEAKQEAKDGEEEIDPEMKAKLLELYASLK